MLPFSLIIPFGLYILLFISHLFYTFHYSLQYSMNYCLLILASGLKCRMTAAKKLFGVFCRRYSVGNITRPTHYLAVSLQRHNVAPNIFPLLARFTWIYMYSKLTIICNSVIKCENMRMLFYLNQRVSAKRSKMHILLTFHSGENYLFLAHYMWSGSTSGHLETILIQNRTCRIRIPDPTVTLRRNQHYCRQKNEYPDPR